MKDIITSAIQKAAKDINKSVQSIRKDAKKGAR